MNEHPQKSESPAATGQIANHETHAQIVAPGQIVGNAEKHLTTLKAQLALKGFSVHDLATGGYFVTKWNLTMLCPALADLEAFALQVGMNR